MGVIVIDKDLGFTSMDVCAIVRGRFRKGGAPKNLKVGHGGTLDPLATGVLVVLVGKATKLCDLIMAGEKEYEATIDLSKRSTTDDLEGEQTLVDIARPPTREDVALAAVTLTGRIMQRPPNYSAIKVGGKRAYAEARKGNEVTLAERPVDVHSFEILEYVWPSATVRVRCGKGTYIRSLARDLGGPLGAGGMLTQLRRTRVGRFSIEGARKLRELDRPLTASDLQSVEDLFREHHIRGATGV
jgi:tRNA pseudouridine55 synthase